MNLTTDKPHIVMIVPRGEAVRNFLYSDTLQILHDQARITLLSVVDDERFMTRFRPLVDEIIPLKEIRERRLVSEFRHLLHEAHFRWLWSKVAQNVWELRAYMARSSAQKLRWAATRAGIRLLANRPTLEILTELERYLSWRLRPGDDFVALFRRLQPDLVFNCSHIHGPAGELPAKIAYYLGIPTAGFIFSWDNLTSRSRIFVPYNYYFVWHKRMKQQLLNIYPRIAPEHVFVTGTPQFDFHFKPEYLLTREALAQQIGIDSTRPFIFYTTGINKHFPEEHRHVAFIADFLAQEFPDVQLVVRTYVKGTSAEMKTLAAEERANVVFPQVQWDDKWFMPAFEDLAVYTGCLRHAAMGINAASTVSLELMMFDKPVMNIGFDPPGSHITPAYRWRRHIEFDHYQPVADSGAVMVAWSTEDIKQFIRQGLTQPNAAQSMRRDFLSTIFGRSLDGYSGNRVAECLLKLANHV